MYDKGILKLCQLIDISAPGNMPKEVLTVICEAYYDELTVGVTRHYSALSANQKIDLLVRCYNTPVIPNAEYVLIGEDQYRITLKQKRNDDVDLTLERLGGLLDVYRE